jgi:DNA polymerase-3 subunit alpha (Gram-positive type)
MDIHFFTPVQHPVFGRDTDIITTHFDYHSINDRFVKLDILGHDAPTIIKLLEDLTGIFTRDIPIADKDTLSLFSATEALGLKAEELGSPVGTFGIPEFDTKFVRDMLWDTKPQCFSDLVRISGYSHGTGVWLNNAQDLIKNKTASMKEIIAARDDIMLFLLQQGVDERIAYNIMEDVRKGKGVKSEYQQEMRKQKVPEWYIESCQKIRYLFPKAHAVAYIIMAYRIAYCKVHYPKEFYTVYFSIHAKEFGADLILRGSDAVKKRSIAYIIKVKRLAKEKKNFCLSLKWPMRCICAI